jgi:membrane fusion protein (multidrug efflux system)
MRGDGPDAGGVGLAASTIPPAPTARTEQLPSRVEAPPPAPPAPARGSLPRLLIPLLALGSVLLLVAGISLNWNALLGAAAVQRTDDAVVRADITRLSARVAGNISRVAVTDYQVVKAGSLLVEIDPAEYQAAQAAAEASLAQARAQLANLANQKALQQATIQQVQAQRSAVQAAELQTRQERDRQVALLAGGLAGTRQRLEQATADHDKSVADLQASDAAIVAQRRQLDVLDGQDAQLRAALQGAEANLQTASLRLGYTRILAPFDGMVGEREVRPSDYVTVGRELVAVVPLPQVYVTANFKETQLTRVAPGQRAEITVDMFPGEVLRGRVAGLSPASGATFALLPPDNATGNFTKVVQRLPVRIDLDPGQPLLAKLRPGTSVVASIHVDDAATGETLLSTGQAGAARPAETSPAAGQGGQGHGG